MSDATKVDLKSLPPHLKTEVGLWLDYAGSVDKADPVRFVADVLSTKTLTSRVSCINALSEWFTKHRGEPDPFAANPYPYPLLTKYLPMSFDEAWAYVQRQPQPQRAWLALVLLCRLKAEDVVKWDGVTKVPLNAAAMLAIGGYTKPRNAAQVRAAMPPGVKVTDFHAALFHALKQRGVPEVTTAALYGRWSAMKFEVAQGRVGYFRGPALKVGVGLEKTQNQKSQN